MKGRLKGMRAYLIGPMDECADLGKSWRIHLQKFLWGLRCGVLNPCDKAINVGLEDEELHLRLNKLRELIQYNEDAGSNVLASGCYDEIERLMNPVVSVDFAMVDRADFIVMYIDKDMHMCGTYAEETLAVSQKKPVIICCKQGKHAIPNFCFKRMGRHHMMFGNWDGVKSYLIQVDADPLFEDTSNTWRFFDYDKVYNGRLK
jgi:hypothetical protein